MIPVLGMVPTTPKPEPNTNTNTPMKNKDGLLHKLATAVAACYYNLLNADNPRAGLKWADFHQSLQHSIVSAMSEALPKAIRQEMPHGYPTRAHLRSHLSIDQFGPYPKITGFDDLYEDVRLCIDAARVPDVRQQDIGEIEELRVLLDNTSKSLQTAIHERDAVKESLDARTSQRDEAEAQLIKADQNLKEMTASRDHERIGRQANHARAIKAENQLIHSDKRISELESGCDTAADMWQPFIVSLQKRLANEALICHTQSYIIQRIASICGMTEGNGEDLIKKIVDAKGAGEKLKLECQRLQLDLDKSRAAGHKLALEIHRMDGANEKLKAEVAHLKDIDRVLTDKLDPLRKDADRLSNLASIRLSQINQLRDANDELNSRSDSLKDEIKAVLGEFGVESPTDDIMDMVRSACESGRALNQTGAPTTRGTQEAQSTQPIHTCGQVHWDSGRASKSFRTDGPHDESKAHRSTQRFGGNRVVAAFGNNDSALDYSAIPSRIYGAVPRVYNRVGEGVIITGEAFDHTPGISTGRKNAAATTVVCIGGALVAFLIGKCFGA
jgi:hypothetical protein